MLNKLRLPRRQGSSWWIIVPFCSVITVFAIDACSSDRQPVIPDIELEGMEPQVVTKITRLRESVMGHPEDASAWGKFAMNLYAHELLPAAALCFQEASRLEPEEFRWLYFCAVTLHSLGKDEALDWYRRAILLQPDNAQVHVRMGDAYLSQGAYEDASRSFSKAIELDDARLKAYIGLAQIEYNRKNYTEATELLEKAIGIQPNLRPAHALLISCYRMQFQQDKVAAASKRLSELEGEVPFAFVDPILDEIALEGVSFQWYMERGEQYLQAQQPEKAASEFRRALEIRSEASAYSQLGIALMQLNRPADAILNFRQAHEQSPNAAVHAFNLGFALCDNDHPEEGISFLERACQLAPLGKNYSKALVEQYIRNGRWLEASQFAGKVYASTPKNVRMGLTLAWILATCPRDELRDGAKAIQIAGTIVRTMNSPSPQALDCLAAAYAEGGQFSLAAETISQAIQMAESAGEQQQITEFKQREKRYLQNRPWRTKEYFWR